MTTLIAVYGSEGCEGRCDARCYNATSATYDCICGGKNHGAGLTQAADNTRAMFKDWIEQWNRDHPKTTAWEVPAAQLALPI